MNRYDLLVKIISNCDLSGAPEAVSILEEVGALYCLGDNRRSTLTEITDCDALMAHPSVRVDRELLDCAPKLRFVGSPHTGKDHLDIDFIKKRDLHLAHIAEEVDLLSTFTATSEMAFALLLAVVRKLPQAFDAAKTGSWGREKFTGFQLLGKTLGVLGLGRLGTISARIGQGFGMSVIAHDPQEINVPSVKMVDLDTLLADSDILTIHVHLNSETENLINERTLSKMKPGSLLINTSRGRIVDETALVSALKSGHLGVAGLDVIDGEWLTLEERAQHPLVKYSRTNENLIIVPHIGGSTKESIYGARVFMAKKIAEWARNSA